MACMCCVHMLLTVGMFLVRFLIGCDYKKGEINMDDLAQTLKVELTPAHIVLGSVRAKGSFSQN